MNVSWDAPLKRGQLRNPVIYGTVIDLPPDIPEYGEEDLKQVFRSKKQSLKTWGRSESSPRTEPHWIGVHKGTPLHTDPAYPRYTHHLMLAVDDYVLRGVDLVETKLVRGLFYIVDTHSPHQLLAKSDDARWYLAVSLDSKVPLSKHEALPRLIEYGRSAPLLTEMILGENNGGRWATK